MIILEENFNWHLEAFASELFKYSDRISCLLPLKILQEVNTPFNLKDY